MSDTKTLWQRCEALGPQEYDGAVGLKKSPHGYWVTYTSDLLGEHSITTISDGDSTARPGVWISEAIVSHFEGKAMHHSAPPADTIPSVCGWPICFCPDHGYCGRAKRQCGYVSMDWVKGLFQHINAMSLKEAHQLGFGFSNMAGVGKVHQIGVWSLSKEKRIRFGIDFDKIKDQYWFISDNLFADACALVGYEYLQNASEPPLPESLQNHKVSYVATPATQAYQLSNTDYHLLIQFVELSHKLRPLLDLMKKLFTLPTP